MLHLLNLRPVQLDVAAVVAELESIYKYKQNVFFNRLNVEIIPSNGFSSYFV